MRKCIVDGSYAPGKRIVMDQMAKELGSSAIPVREAITCASFHN
ncbi:GntR family transcriptional regulator [Shouchella patagoniensis]